MGTGKGTVGKIVAAQLGMTFVDTDEMIEAEAGQSIAAIFAESGEAVFRRVEARVCQRVAGECGQVIAVGGGALLDEQTRTALDNSGLLVCLTAEVDEIMRRVGHDPSRPLFGARATVEQLLARRSAHYASFAHHIDTTHRSPEQAAEEIIELWKSNG